MAIKNPHEKTTTKCTECPNLLTRIQVKRGGTACSLRCAGAQKRSRAATARPGQSHHLRKYGEMYFQPKTAGQAKSFWDGRSREGFSAACAAESMRMRGSKEYFMRYGQIVWE